jgi:N-acetylneuraminic acid mutarotase/transposase-like protein
MAAETADNARLEAALLDLRHQCQAAQADALDEHMGVCRDTLTAWMRDAARRKRNEREELAAERAAMLREVATLRAGVTTDRAALEATLTMLQGQAKAQETRVLLEVGGVRFTTSVATLRTVPDSYFDAMFGGRFSAAGEDGLDSYEDEETGELVYFIDRDGYAFRHILEFLRDGGKSLARLEDLVAGGWKGAWKLRGLKREFGYFLIDVDQAAEAVEGEEEELAVMRGGVGRGEVGVTLAVGGWSNAQRQSAVWRYDPAGDAWEIAAPMATARSQFGMCVLAGEVYACGGRITGANRASVGGADRTASVEKYTPSSNTWNAVPDMPGSRRLHGVCAVGTDMYVVGGRGGSEKNFLKFNSVSGEWSEMEKPMPENRLNAAVCAIGTNIFVAGGYLLGRHLNTLLKYNTEAIGDEEWSTLAYMPDAFASGSMCTLDGKLYILGGVHSNLVRDTVYVYDATADTWGTLAPMPTARYGMGVFVRDGCICAVGGIGSDGRQVNTVERYDPATNTWTAMRPFPNAITKLHCCTVGNGEEAENAEADFFDTLIARAEAVGRMEGSLDR